MDIRKSNCIAFTEWRQDFLSDAYADNYSLFRSHLAKLGLQDKPQLLITGTVELVRAVTAFCSIDGRSCKEYLGQQHHNPARSLTTRYVVIFDIFGRSYGRMLVHDLRSDLLDLADLFDFPWSRYKLVGYERILISHPDWSPMTGDELQELEKAITADIYFDYAEDEVQFWFNVDSDATVLTASFQDLG